MKKIFAIIEKLTRAGIYFELRAHREGYIMIAASVPGERWEIEVSSEGVVDFEIFSSSGEIQDEIFLNGHLSKFAE